MSLFHSMNRRSVLSAAAAGAAGLLPVLARAQGAWPSARPIKIIEVSAPGGSGDVMARMAAGKLAPRLGQQVVVENRTGAGGTLGTDSVAKSPADGYTLLMDTTAIATNSASGKKLPYDPQKDFTPIGQIGATPLLIVVPAESPIKTLRDLLERARARPNEGIRYGSSGIGTMSHIGMELLGSVANVQMLHVPYRGVTLSINDLLSGRLQAALGTVATYAPLLESGKLRGIVVTSPQRSPFLPTLPTTAEAGYPGYLIEYWWGLSAPAGTPPDVVKRLNAELNAFLAEPDTREFLAKLAAIPKPGTAEEFGRMAVADVARWAKVIRDANIKVE